MNDDYLWDRSGQVDREIERLEKTLAPLRYRHRDSIRETLPPQRRLWWGAIAALLVAALALWQLRVPASQATAWQVAKLEGAANVGGRAADVSMAVRTGQLLRTAGDSRVSLQADDVGQIDLGPDSELRAAGNQRMVLGRGQLHAFIWARPGLFTVDTPSARAVDLGCEYTITVDTAGNGVLRVKMGWVAFQAGGRESFIPAGAECATRRREGPGIPYYQDAPEALRQSAGRLDRGDRGALDGLLTSARPQDALTLWHLLTRVADADRGRVFDRFAQLVTVPPGVSREGVLGRDAHAIDQCWDALNLENTSWWRGWERKW